MKSNRNNHFSTLRVVCCASFLAMTVLSLTVYADHDHTSETTAREAVLDVTFSSGKDIVLSGTLAFPDREGPFHCVVIAGGTLSNTRDGELATPGAPKRDALKRLSHELVEAGYATLRFDKRGYGLSSNPTGVVTYQDQAEDLKAAMLFARRRTDILSVIVAGESAGAYLACLAAKDLLFADGYLFLGGLASSSPEMYAHNFGRLKEWAEKSAENMAWAKQNAFHDLRTGYGYEAMFQAAREGKETFTFSLDGKDWTMPLERKREELKNEPGDLFQYIRKPALAIQGELDMNVPPGDNQKAADIMKKAGNIDVVTATIIGADHSFQEAAPDYDTRIKERFSFASFSRPYNEEFYHAVIQWLNDRFPSDAGLTDATHKWGGVQVIDDITNPAECPGVDTVEGRIGPLMKAEGSQCHYIEMIPGQYTGEHPHSTESIIFTVKGQWVLCRAGHRKLMKPGTLYHFGRNIPTGYEVPFDEPAYILIFKSELSDWSDERFFEYLRGLKDNLERQNKEGVPFFLRELPADHPARIFARKINLDWESKLPK
jgi:uncharacterized protein